MVRCGEEGQSQAALAVLRDLAMTPEHCACIVQYGGIAAMVDVLSSGASPQACVYAGSCLRSLALNKEWAQEVRLYQLLRRLVNCQ